MSENDVFLKYLSGGGNDYHHLPTTKLFRPVQAVKSSAAPDDIVSVRSLGKANFMRNSFESYSKEGYSINAIVYRCISRLSLELQGLQDGKFSPAEKINLITKY